MSIDYGFQSSDDVQYDKQGAPLGNHLVMITGEELKEQPEKPENPRILIVDYEVLDGAYKGKSFKVWYNLFHSNATTANIAKQSLKRIADATNRPVSPAAPLKGRVFRIDVRPQKKDDRYTEIAKYLPESGSAGDDLSPP